MSSLSPQQGRNFTFFPNGTWEKADAVVGLGMFCALFLVFSAPVFLPYLLLDDNWIMRGNDDPGSYPSTRFIAAVQGRPLFAVLVFFSRQLSLFATPFDAIAIIRFVCIVLLACSGLLIHKFARSLGLGVGESICIAIGAMTLPTFQVFVGNGPWLSLPLFLVLFGVYLAKAGLTEKKDSLIIIVVLQQALFLSALATYQSLVLVAISLVLFSILFGTRIQDRFVLITVGNVIYSIAVYYVAWQLLYQFSYGDRFDPRYAPGSISFDIIGKLSYLIDFRLPQALNLWRVSAGHLGYVVALLVLGGAAAAWCNPGGNGRPGSSTVSWKIVAIVVAMFLSDAIALASRQPIRSYTSLTALSLTVYFAAVWALQSYAAFLRNRGAAPFRFSLAGLMVLAVINSQYTVTREFAIPVWVETELVRSRLKEAINNQGGIDQVVVYINKKLFSEERVYEYNFTNLGNAFYIKWTIKNILHDLGASEDVEIKTVTISQKPGLSALLDESGKSRRLVVIDLSGF